MGIEKGRPWFFKKYIRFPNNILLGYSISGAPTNGTSGTLAGKAGPGSLLIDYASGSYYVNTNTKASPTWTVGTGLSGAITPTTIVATTSVRSTGATAANGYSTGAGGAVTQATDSTTGVTLSKPCGQITTVALTTAAAAEEVFTVTNTLVAATDVIAVSTTYAGAGTILVGVKKVAASAFDIVITNLHTSAALNAAAVINFAVIKAVAS